MASEKEILKDIGFEEREAKIYLSMLRLGESTASRIAEDVEIDRTTTYDLLNRLIKKGAVSYVVKEGIKYFSPASPHKLIKELKEKESELEGILPSLLELSNTNKEETSIEVFKGKEAVKTIFEMIIHDREDYLLIGAVHEVSKLGAAWIRKLVAGAYKTGIHGKLLCEEGFGDDPEVDIVGKNETYRFISKEFTTTTTQIWGNKTALFVLAEPFYTILIQNKEIADRHRLYFDYLWKQAKEPTKEHKRKTRIKDS